MKKYYLHLLKYLPGDLLIKNIQGSKMYLNPSDPGISTELFFEGTHEKQATEIFRKELKKGMVVIDVGANIGYYALQEASIVGKKGQVHAIEPILNNVNALNKNIELNKYKNIKTYQIAISSKSGTSKMTLTDSSNQNTMIDSSASHASEYTKKKMDALKRKVIKINTISIDEFIKKEKIKQINCIRMDVEGYETEVIKGASNTLKNSPAPLKLFIEIHNKLFKNPEQIIKPEIERILSYGFKPKYLIIPSKNKIISDFNETDFISTLFSHKSDCPHIFLEK